MTRSVVKDEWRLLWRLGHEDEDDNVEKRGGTPVIAMRPGVPVVHTPPLTTAAAFDDESIGVREFGFGANIAEHAADAEMHHALCEFVSLHDADTARIADYASRFGALRRCPCGEPLGDGFDSSSHRYDVTQRTPWIEARVVDQLGRLDDVAQTACRSRKSPATTLSERSVRGSSNASVSISPGARCSRREPSQRERVLDDRSHRTRC